MKWSEPQESAIFKRDQNILVSAAAGSGKTAVLVERIKQLIIQDEVGVREMLVVTFSNAAASEMRERLVLSLSAEIEKGGAKEAFLRDQLSAISTANISTFHAFAMEIIRRYFYLIDVEPNFRICDEPYKIILQSSAMDQLFDELFMTKDAGFISFLDKFASSKNENDVKNMVLEVHKFIQSLPDSFPWFEEKVDELSVDPETFLATGIYAEVRNEINSGLSRTKGCFEKAERLIAESGVASLLGKCRLDIETVETLIEIFNTRSFDEFSDQIKSIKLEVFKASKEDSETYAVIKEQVKAYRDKGKSIIKTAIIEKYMGKSLADHIFQLKETYVDGLYLYQMVKRFDELYKEKKREKGLIDFNDIEHYALEILSNESAAAEYRNKFSHIFIDEYQDSNIVQETLISRIKRQNNLFMVGDVKQSIYKFRLAEPELFMSKYDSYSQENNPLGIKIDLNLNFRSKGNIIKTINGLFSLLMQRPICGLDYDEAAALHKGIAYEGDLDYPVRLYLADNKILEDEESDDEINEMKKAEVEAAAAVKIIKGLLGQPIFDDKLSITRKASYKDIVILFRSAKGYADVFGEMLMQENIPNFVDIGDGYFDTMEVAVFLNLLRVIDNKKQDIPLLSVLRSPIFGFTPEELGIIRIQKPKGNYFSAFESYVDEQTNPVLTEKCRTAKIKIAGWKAASAFMTLEELLWKLIRETGYYDYIGAIPGSAQRQANLRALVDKAVQFQEAHMKGLFGFITYIELLKKDKVSTSQVKMISENDDVIRIMTVHKSKGLEFPIVMVCGLGKRFNKDRNSFKVNLHKNMGIGLRYVDQKNGCYSRTLIQTLIEEQKNREGTAEEIRILYVAMTRAKDQLILLGTLKNAEDALVKIALKDEEDITNINNYLEWILLAQMQQQIPISIVDRSDIALSRKKSIQNRAFVKQSLEQGFSGDMDPKIVLLIKERLSWHYSFVDAQRIPSKMSVSEIKKPERISLGFSGSPKFRDTEKHFSGEERGTFIHKVLEHIPFNLGVDESGVRYQISLMVQNEVLTAEQAASIDLKLLMNFFKSDIYKRAANSERVYKEVSFNLAKDASEVLDSPPEVSGEKIIVQGTIDCYFKEEDRFILLDYKSDYIPVNISPEDMNLRIAQYKIQLSLYKEALEKIRGIKISETYLFFLSVGKEVKIEF